MISKFVSIVAISLLVCPFATAKPYKLPAGTRLQTPQGTFQGYSLEEMKILLKMDVDLESCDFQFPELRNLLSATEQLVKANEAIIKSKDVQIDILKKEQSRLTEKWSQENKLRHECENKPRFGSWVAWAIAAVSASTAIALGVTLAVTK